jgi:hypothetical protein
MKIYRTAILPAILNGFETWPLALREEHRLKIFVNRVQSKIFEPKRDGIMRTFITCTFRQM